MIRQLAGILLFKFNRCQVVKKDVSSNPKVSGLNALGGSLCPLLLKNNCGPSRIDTQ